MEATMDYTIDENGRFNLKILKSLDKSKNLSDKLIGLLFFYSKFEF
jgi:hypothetical protein